MNKQLKGQLSIFDINIIEVVEKVTKTNEKITEKPINITELSSVESENENDKDKRPLKLTFKQDEFLKENQILENENLSRVIIYACGHIGIEYEALEGIETIVYSKGAEEILRRPKEIPIIAIDKIYYSKKDYEINDIQKTRLEKIREDFNIKHIISRKGDKNLIVIHDNGIIGVNPIGWTMNYENINNIEYTEDEILNEHGQDEKLELHKGDKVIVKMLTREVNAEVAHIYNNGESICFIYDNKYTATHISRILGKVS